MNSEEEAKTAAKQLKELQDLQRKTGKAVAQLLTNPKTFLMRYDYVYRGDGKDMMILKLFKNTKIRMAGDFSMLDEVLYQSMRLNGCSIFEYADSMATMAKTCEDPYFLQILAKRIQQMTDAEWQAADDVETERS